MQIKTLLIAALSLSSALLMPCASAEFILIDDLTTGHTAGELVGQVANGPGGGTWQAAGALGAVSIGTSADGLQAAVASATAGGGAAYINLPTPISASSTAATIFFQFDMGANLLSTNVNWSFENVNGATSSAGTPPTTNVVELNSNAPNRPNGVTIRNGTAFVPMLIGDGVTAFEPAPATIYNIWYLVNNSAQTFEVYMSGGALGETPVHMEIGTAGNFTGLYRNPAPGTDTTSFIFGPGGAGNPAQPSLLTLSVDSTSFNTSYPPVVAVPEPTAAMLLMVGAGVATILRRRRS